MELYCIFLCVCSTYISYIITDFSLYAFWHVWFGAYLNVLNKCWNKKYKTGDKILHSCYRVIMSVVDRRYDCSTHCLWGSHFALYVINSTIYSFVWNREVHCFIIFQCKFFTHFGSSNILTEYRFCSDMMFPSCRLGLSLLLAVIYFLVSVALSLPPD